MKKIILSLFVGFQLVVLNAQEAPPQGINYQAVVYIPTSNQLAGVNSSGQQPANSQQVKVTFTLEEGFNGPIIYEETHADTTDSYGLLNSIIGTGIPTGNSPGLFNQIDWSLGDPYLRVSIELTEHSTSISSYQKLWSVPYALYAGNANTANYAIHSGNGITGVIDNGNGTLTFNYFDGSSFTTPVLTGLMGNQGPAGNNGLSAYQIALNNGFVGTETQWLNSLQGTPGQQGPTGPVGPQGLTGNNGLSAYQIALSNGFVGTETQWLNSLQGATGQVGPQGPVGATGPQGPQGPSGSGGFSTMQVYSTPGSYSFTIPTGINKIMIEVWGGGGGGGNSSVNVTGSMTSGAGGGYGKEIFSVTPGASYTVIVGAGGTSSGGNGGTTSFGSLISATGGQGGLNLGSPFFLPAGGSSSAAFNVTGEAGVLGFSAGGQGVKGGDSFGSTGGRGGYNGAVASPGNSPGGGGASGSGFSTVTYITGAPGAPGRVVVWY